MTTPSPERPSLREAARALLEHYLGLANSGDCGNWDPETEVEVIDLRLALTEEEANLPSREKLARVIDPEAWEPFSTASIFWLAEKRAGSLTKASAILALLPAQGAWRPISEAPRDGTMLLLAEHMPNAAGSPWSIVTGWWDKNFENLGWDEEMADVSYRGAWNAGRVRSWNYQEYQEERPTHFRPLPPPPNPEVAALEREEE